MLNQEQAELQKNMQIEELVGDIAKGINGVLVCEIINLAEHLTSLGYQKVDKDSIVLSMEEYERLCSSHDIVFCDNKGCVYNRACRSCEITGCQLNIPEYDKKLKINKHKLDLFEKLCKERERANSWEDRYNLLQEELNQISKETAEKIFNNLLKEFYKRKSCGNADVVVYEIAKQYGVEVE